MCVDTGVDFDFIPYVPSESDIKKAIMMPSDTEGEDQKNCPEMADF
ncbi:hypothetical protein KAR91_88555 [Candidatus Pacearchaeota archaeon]|nr:hypothetical protein [Candidatus Pacearchaeota archaeon]